MIICHCRKLTHRDVNAAIDAGAATEGDVERMCGAGGRCGGCRRSVRELIDERAPDRASALLPLAPTG